MPRVDERVGCGVWTRTKISGFKDQRPARLDDTATGLVAGEGVAPSVGQAYETCEPLLLYARENFSRMAGSGLAPLSSVLQTDA